MRKIFLPSRAITSGCGARYPFSSTKPFFETSCVKFMRAKPSGTSVAYAIECTASNLFLRYGDRLLTPDLSQCGVAGVTRQRIISLASQLGLAPDICQLPLAELMAADEVIICNSLFGAWQVTEFNGKTWPSQALAKDLRNLLLGQI